MALATIESGVRYSFNSKSLTSFNRPYQKKVRGKRILGKGTEGTVTQRTKRTKKMKEEIKIDGQKREKIMCLVYFSLRFFPSFSSYVNFPSLLFSYLLHSSLLFSSLFYASSPPPVFLISHFSFLFSLFSFLYLPFTSISSHRVSMQ